MGKLVEGLWDCSYCGGKGIRGGVRECPHCGKPRDENVRFYMPSQISYVDEESLNEISREADWICKYCGSLNSAKVTVCESCSALRDSDNLDYIQNRRLKEHGNSNNTESTSSQVYEEPASNPEPIRSSLASTAESQSSNVRSNSIVEAIGGFFSDYGSIIATIAIIATVVFGIIWLLVPKSKNVTVDHKYWERSVEIEAFRTVDEADWILPDGARLHDTKTEIFSFKQVLDHYEDKTRQVSHQRIVRYEEKVVGYKDLGNGYFEEITKQEPVYETYYETEHYQEPVYRQEPIYKTKYYYEIDKWCYDRTIPTNGVDNDPYWADTSELDNKLERAGKRTEKYTASVTTSKGKSMEIDFSYDEWVTISRGESIKVKVSVFGNGKLEK